MASVSLQDPQNSSTSSASSNNANTIVLTQQTLVPITTSSSVEYVKACALSNQKASRNDPLTLLFQAEKLPPLPDEPLTLTIDGTARPSSDALRARLARLSNDEIEQMIYESGVTRMTAKCQLDGAFVAEAGNFAAVTCWDPMYAPKPLPGWESLPDLRSSVLSPAEPTHELVSNGIPISEILKKKPIFGEFWVAMEMSKYKHLYPFIWRFAQNKRLASKNPRENAASEQSSYEKEHLKYWYICLTSRNPAVQPPVPGAVRAVIQPLIKKFIYEDDIPAIWILAGNERARDVYQYFGFRVVDEIIVGQDEKGKGNKTWCMMYSKEATVAESQ